MENILPKITLKDLGCNGAAAAALQKEGERIYLARIYGEANGLKTKEDKRTNTFHTSLTGNFRARVLQPGVDNHDKTFSSGVLFLPGGLHEMIQAVLEKDASAAVTFGFDVYAYKVNRAGAQYSYGAVSLAEPEKDDPLSRLEASFAPLPQIEGPKSDTSEPEPKGAKHKATEPAA